MSEKKGVLVLLGLLYSVLLASALAIEKNKVNKGRLQEAFRVVSNNAEEERFRQMLQNGDMERLALRLSSFQKAMVPHSSLVSFPLPPAPFALARLLL